MKHFQYVIVGGGLTGDAAVRGIREIDQQGSIGLFSKEPDPPYSRPSLSKGLWKGKPLERIWRNTQTQNVEMHLNSEITNLNPTKKIIIDGSGNEYSFDKLLLATGVAPIMLPFAKDHIIYFRDFQDYQNLRKLSEEKDKFLVIGGGFIGTEIAAALTMVGKKAIMLFMEDSIGENLYPKDLSHFLNDYYREKSVEIFPAEAVQSIDFIDNHYDVKTKSGQSFVVDGVVAGIGVRPNITLEKEAGLLVDNGIVVDEKLRTSAENIYAAGDVANFFHASLMKRVRVEHEDNALFMGKQAGRNMAGADESYQHIPIFYSDMFDLGYEAVGEVNSKLETIADWSEPYKEGVVYYLDGEKVRGILMWNVWDAVPAARAILTETLPIDKANLNLQFLLDTKKKLKG